MPTYEYTCSQCGKKFSVMMTVAERDTQGVRCPKCNSTNVVRRISTFYAVTGKKS